VWLVPGGTRQVAVAGGFGIGAPAAAIVLEELVAFGTSEFISIGTAGCLQPHYGFGEPVVCTGAIRDEGVSHHYLPARKLARPSGPLTTRFSEALAVGGPPPEVGLTWTIDAPYRETLAEARRYQSEGVICVEMEAAALFAVGGYRGADVAAGFVVSDHLLAGEEWTHAFGSEAVRGGLVRLLDAALLTLGAAPGPVSPVSPVSPS
jgi:uridine phosphorylase